MSMSDDDQNSEQRGDVGGFHIVGIGASAGGLQPLEDFFDAIPDDSGMAFVVVQHLSPDFKSHMEDLLSRKTRMAIHRVENGMQVEPNTVYLIPPKMEMVIKGGRLLLTEKGPDRSLSHPVDQFFRSLADDAGALSVGIILSGTGSDGSRGIRDIHDAGGLVVSQDAHTAKFDGMPLNAQSTGAVHLILPPSDIAEALVRYTTEDLRPAAMEAEETAAAMKEGANRIFQLLHQLHGIDFSHYKANTVGRRIQRRIDLLGLKDLDEYVALLNEDSTELNDLYKDLLIGVTKFFRDPEAFSVLENEVIPRLFSDRDRDHTIRVWVAGCASGEEAYSIAMLLDEEAERRGVRPEFKIFATDAHHVSLNTAAKGIYPEEAFAEVTEERLGRYFNRQLDGFQVTPELRKHIVFAPHNLINDAPFTQMDLVTCRNLLIYLQPIAQRKALSMFHFALKASGTLFLGPSETPGEIADEFQTINKRWRFYRKRRDVRLPMETRLPLATSNSSLMSPQVVAPTVKSPRVDPSMLAMYDRLLDRRMPPSILIDEEYEILHIFGGAERYLQPRGGRPSNNLLAIAVESLRSRLAGALQHAARKNDVVQYTGIQINKDGNEETVHLLVEPIIDHASGAHNLLVEFAPVTEMRPTVSEDGQVDVNRADMERITTLESDLRYAQENLQATIEEMETSNEELHATNEELMASNEELQSTNEELHSVNEELYTVNAEYQRRVEELAESNADMDNLLATTRVGVIFLDTDLRIRRFTPEMARLFQLMEHDIGRSIEGFSHYLDYEELHDELQTALEKVQEREFFASHRAGIPYLVRVLPYRSDDKVEGLVVTLVDIKSLRKAEAEVEKFKFMAESSADPMLLLNSDSRIEYANPNACETLQYSRDTLQTMTLKDIDEGFDSEKFPALFATAATATVPKFETDWRRQDGTTLPVEVSISRVDIGDRSLLFANIRDITERRDSEVEMRLRTTAMDSATSGILISDANKPDLPITYANPAFYRLTGYDENEVIGRNCRFLQGKGTKEKHVRTLRDAIRNQKECKVTIKNYRRDGSWFWNDLHVSPVFDERGILRNYVGVQHDVTAEIEARDRSRSETKRIAAIMNATAEGMYGVNLDGSCTFANSACVGMLGYESVDELIGRNMHQLIHSMAVDGTPTPEKQCQIHLVTKTGDGTHVDDEVFWRKDGSCFPVEYRSEPLYKQDDLTGAVVSFQDISERLAVAGQLEQLGAMIDASHDAIIIWELDGGIVQWNTGAVRLYGFEAQEAVGRITHSLFKTSHPDGWQAVRSSLIEQGDWVGILEHQTKEGETLSVSSRHQLLTLSDGQRYVLEINRDYSEQARVQETLQNANKAFQQANEAKTQFLANISHELRTPMTAVLGFAEMLKGHSDDSEYRDKVATITRNGQYLLALLNDILDLSKIEAGKMDVKRESVSVPKLIEDVQALMDNRSEEEGVPLTFEFMTDVPSFVTADRTRIRQILVNLIGNALKFTDEGTVRVQVDFASDHVDKSVATLTNSGAGNYLRVQVIDTGIGMTQEQVDALFQPFAQASAETSRKFGGTGLGLSISRRLAEAMGGSISVESEFRRGSTFALCLPVSDTQRKSMGRPKIGKTEIQPDQLINDVLPGINARILLADDRRDVWRVARYFLEKCGAEVEIAEDGRQAVDAVNRSNAEGNPFNLILMDMQMPIMTGQEAVAALRHQGCRLPIIALTADAMEGERESCLAIGCDEYSPKPIDGPVLMRLVKKLIDKGRSEHTTDG